MLGGLPERRDAATRWPFTSPAACSIFNVSQLTAALAGSLVRNATHASVAWQAHASDGVVVAPHGHQTKHRGGRRGLTVLVTERGVTGVTGVVSVFHWKTACPLDPAGFSCRRCRRRSWPAPRRDHRGSGAHRAQPQSRGHGGGQQAPFAVVH